MKIIRIIGFISLLSQSLLAQNTPKYSNEFLNIGVGARALGMASAQTAVANDVTAGYWNPAGLLNIEDKYQGTLMHAEYFAGIAQYDYLAFATPVDSNSHIGVSIIRFGVDDIPDTRFLYDINGAINYNNITFFSSADYAFLLSYARRSNLIKGLQLGANFKIVHRQAGDFATAWGFGLDAGAQLERNGWVIGVMARDITGTFTAWNHNLALIYDIYVQTGNPIPQNSVEVTVPKLSVGVAKRFPVFQNFGFLAALDLASTFDGQRNVLIRSNFASIDPRIGVEADYKQKIFLRFGAGEVQEIKDFDGTTYYTYQMNFGVGLQFKQFAIDYALTDIGDQAEALYSNVFSVKVGF
ncbi:MAG: PorV/PorQ family protein [Thermonemataceae bacterium]